MTKIKTNYGRNKASTNHKYWDIPYLDLQKLKLKQKDRK